MARSLITPGRVLLVGVLVFVLLFACVLVTSMQNDIWIPPDNEVIQFAVTPTEAQPVEIPPSTPTVVKPILTPTPDAPHPLPTIRADADQYIVQPRD